MEEPPKIRLVTSSRPVSMSDAGSVLWAYLKQIDHGDGGGGGGGGGGLGAAMVVDEDEDVGGGSGDDREGENLDDAPNDDYNRRHPKDDRTKEEREREAEEAFLTKLDGFFGRSAEGGGGGGTTVSDETVARIREIAESMSPPSSFTSSSVIRTLTTANMRAGAAETTAGGEATAGRAAPTSPSSDIGEGKDEEKGIVIETNERSVGKKDKKKKDGKEKSRSAKKKDIKKREKKKRKRDGGSGDGEADDGRENGRDGGKRVRVEDLEMLVDATVKKED